MVIDAPDLPTALSTAVRLVEGIVGRKPSLQRILATDDSGAATLVLSEGQRAD